MQNQAKALALNGNILVNSRACVVLAAMFTGTTAALWYTAPPQALDKVFAYGMLLYVTFFG